MSAKNQLTSMQHPQIKIDVAKFLASRILNIARNLSISILTDGFRIAMFVVWGQNSKGTWINEAAIVRPSIKCPSKCLGTEGAVGFEVPQLHIDIDKFLAIFEVKLARSLSISTSRWLCRRIIECRRVEENGCGHAKIFSRSWSGSY